MLLKHRIDCVADALCLRLAKWAAFQGFKNLSAFASTEVLDQLQLLQEAICKTPLQS